MENLGFSHAKKPKGEAKGLGQPFHILNGSGQEALLAHVLNARHASKAQAMVFFGLRKGSFNRLLTPCIYSRTLMQLVKDFFIKFTKKSHLRHLLTEQTLNFVLHGLFCCLIEVDSHHIGGLADLLLEAGRRGCRCVLDGCCIGHGIPPY